MTPDQKQQILTLAVIKKLKTDLESKIADIKKIAKGDDGYTPKKGVDYFDGEPGENYVLTTKDKKEIASSIKVPIVEKVIERTEVIKEQPIVTNQITNEIKEVAKYETAEEIRNKLETLEDEEKLPIKAIYKLREELDELRKLVKQKQTIISGVGGGTGGGRIVKVYDFSSQLNGILKTFSLPAFWRVIDVQIGTIPPLRPTIDYTANASNMTITFTNEIDASTYLSAGLSAIVIFSE